MSTSHLLSLPTELRLMILENVILATFDHHDQLPGSFMPRLLKLSAFSAPEPRPKIAKNLELAERWRASRELVQAKKAIYDIMHVNRKMRAEAKRVLCDQFSFHAVQSLAPRLRDYTMNLFSPVFGAAVYSMCFHCSPNCGFHHHNQSFGQVYRSLTCHAELSSHEPGTVNLSKVLSKFCRIASDSSEIQIWLQLCLHQSVNRSVYGHSRCEIMTSLSSAVSRLISYVPNTKLRIHILDFSKCSEFKGKYAENCGPVREGNASDIVNDLVSSLPQEYHRSIEIGEVLEANP